MSGLVKLVGWRSCVLKLTLLCYPSTPRLHSLGRRRCAADHHTRSVHFHSPSSGLLLHTLPQHKQIPGNLFCSCSCDVLQWASHGRHCVNKQCSGWCGSLSSPSFYTHSLPTRCCDPHLNLQIISYRSVGHP